MKLLTNLFVNGLAVGLAAYLLPGVTIETWQALLVATVVLGILNTFIKPIIKLVALPITIMTLGLFSIVINACMVLLAAALSTGFVVENFWAAIVFSIVLSIISTFLGWISKE
jgi:putative membrane protein